MIRNKKCLLIDSSFACFPIVEALKPEYQVLTVGNMISALYAEEYPENHFCIDYSKIDEIKKILSDNNVLASLPGCTDVSLEMYGKLSVEFGAAIAQVSTKESFKTFCLNLGLEVPRSYRLNEPYAFPVIVKPDDAFSGKGITVVHHKYQVSEAVKNAILKSSSRKYIIQEFLEGQLYSASCFKNPNGSIRRFVVEEYCNLHAYSVDESFLVNPNLDWDYQLDQIVEKLYSGFSDKVRFLHLQFIVSKGIIYLIELMLRCPGDLYSLLVQHSTGLNYGALYAESFGLINSGESRAPVQKIRKVKRLTLKVLPGDIVPEVVLPIHAIDFHRTLPEGYVNTGVLPMRYAVLFLECEHLLHNSSDLNIINKNI